MKEFRPKHFKENNFGNNYITIQSMLSADFANQTEEHFKKCIEAVPTINKLFIDKSKCDNEKHYQETLAFADMLLSMALIERRLGIVKPN